MSTSKFDWGIMLGCLTLLFIVILLDTQAFPNSKAATIRQGNLTGKIVKIEAAAARLTVQHAPVPELDMGAMTMPFRVKNIGELTSLAVGDAVTAVIYEEQETGRMWLENVKKAVPQKPPAKRKK